MDDADSIFGDILMYIGTAMIIVGAVGLSIWVISQAFMMALPLGLVVIFLLGCIVGLIGSSINSSN